MSLQWTLHRIGFRRNSKLFPYTLGEGQTRLGRGIDVVQVLCQSLWVSRFHCDIFVTGDKIFIKDLGSSNGTYLRGQKLDCERLVELKQDDLISLGKPYDGDGSEEIPKDHYVFKITRSSSSNEVSVSNKRKSSPVPEALASDEIPAKKVRENSPESRQVLSTVNDFVDLTSDDELPAAAADIPEAKVVAAFDLTADSCSDPNDVSHHPIPIANSTIASCKQGIDIDSEKSCNSTLDRRKQAAGSEESCIDAVSLKNDDVEHKPKVHDVNENDQSTSHSNSNIDEKSISKTIELSNGFNSERAVSDTTSLSNSCLESTKESGSICQVAESGLMKISLVSNTNEHIPIFQTVIHQLRRQSCGPDKHYDADLDLTEKNKKRRFSASEAICGTPDKKLVPELKNHSKNGEVTSPNSESSKMLIDKNNMECPQLKTPIESKKQIENRRGSDGNYYKSDQDILNDLQTQAEEDNIKYAVILDDSSNSGLGNGDDLGIEAVMRVIVGEVSQGVSTKPETHENNKPEVDNKGNVKELLANSSFSQVGVIEIDDDDCTFSQIFSDNDLDTNKDLKVAEEEPLFLCSSMIKEEDDEAHEETSVDNLFESHFSQCSQDMEPEMQKNSKKVATKCSSSAVDERSQISLNRSCPIEMKANKSTSSTIKIKEVKDTKCTLEKSPSSDETSNLTSPEISIENKTFPSASKEKRFKRPIPSPISGAKLVKSMLHAPTEIGKQTRRKRGRVKGDPGEPSVTRAAHIKRAKEKIVEERKAKLKELALQKAPKANDHNASSSHPVNKENQDAIKENVLTNIKCAKYTESSRSTILLNDFLDKRGKPGKPITNGSRLRSKSSEDCSNENDDPHDQNAAHKTNKNIYEATKTVYLDIKKVAGKSNLKKNKTLKTSPEKNVRFKEEPEIRFYACEGRLNKLNSYIAKDKDPLLSMQMVSSRMVQPSSPDELIAAVVCWNVNWIEESKKVKGDPPVCKEIFLGKDTYISFRDYYRWMFPMILYELWGNIIKSLAEKTLFKSLRCFDGVILQTEVSGKVQILKCCITIARKDVPTLVDPMDNLLVRASPPADTGKHLAMFGVVMSQVKVTNARGVADPFIRNYLHKQATQPELIACFDVKIQNSANKRIAAGYLIKIKPTYHMLTEIRQFEGLKKLEHSALLGTVLEPDQNASVFLPAEIFNRKVVSQFPINDEQERAILGTSQLALSGGRSISLIQGPPGTGKSRVIVGIVEQIYKEMRDKADKKSKGIILLCSQSNAAIDEICLRLLEVRRQLPQGNRFRLTRLGRREKVHREVIPILTTTLARNDVEKMNLEETFKIELDLLRAQEKMWAQNLEDAETRGGSYHNKIFNREQMTSEIDRIKRNYFVVQRRIKELEPFIKKTASDESRRKEIDRLVSDEELKIICRSDIIATTLGSCTSRKISKALKDPSLKKESEDRGISVCLIDEATQATEADTLLPLVHGVKNFILVGDQQQLPPTVISETSKTHGFSQSLFSRLHKVWSKTMISSDDQESGWAVPIFPLKVQMRMHPEIAAFPSKAFYNDELITPEFLSVNRGYRPYAVFTHSHCQDETAETNENEADVVVNFLLDEIIENPLFKALSIGIIVPYQKQRFLLMEKLNHKKFHRLVTVHTIDSAQGQEKDVVILSTVRTTKAGFLSDYQRLNVAITRAKRALYIVGNFTSLQDESIWKSLLDDATERGVIKELPANCKKSDISKFLVLDKKRKRSK